MSTIKVSYGNNWVKLNRVMNMEVVYQSFATPNANLDQGSTKKSG